MANFNYAQLDPYSLGGAGVVAGATTVTLKSFQTIDGALLTMAAFGSKGFGTLEPGNGSMEEQIVFTGVVQNANGTATLTGVSSVTFLTPYTETSGLTKTHAGATTFVISNTSGYYNMFGAKENDETLTGFWNAPDPLAAQGIATKNYVDTHVNGGPVTTNALIESGTAGETLVAGQPVYLKAADGRWYKALGTTAATVNDTQLGIAQGAGTTGNPITSGVLRRGVDLHQTGGAAGSLGYISDTGTISTTTGTVSRVIGNFLSGTTFDFDPFYYYIPTSPQKDFLAGVTGMFFQYGGSSAPTGYLLCDGSAVSRATYAALFTVIGTSYGAGDGSTTFNLPDGRGRGFIGAGTGTKVATFASRASNVITVTGLTNANNNEFQTGELVTYHTTGTVITGLTNDTGYYLVRTGNLAFSLATTLVNAQNASIISLSSDGTGTQTFTLSLTARSIGNTGGEETHAMSLTELLAHIHPLSSTYPNTGGAGSGGPSLAATVAAAGSLTTTSIGGNASMNVMNPFFVGNWIVKT